MKSDRVPNDILKVKKMIFSFQIYETYNRNTQTEVFPIETLILFLPKSNRLWIPMRESKIYCLIFFKKIEDNCYFERFSKFKDMDLKLFYLQICRQGTLY